MTWTVTRDDNVNRKFRCINNWMENINAQNDYTAVVAWGPDSVSIQGDTTFYTNTAGSLTLTLTCQANEINPSSALTYSWNIPCDNPQQRTCSFKPRPPDGSGDNGDVNRMITCTATNTKNNNRARQDTVTLNLKYPPRSPPQISGYTNNQVLYKGDSLNLTCNVNGGDPQVKTVTLTCPGHEQSPTTGQWSTLKISALSDSDHAITCVCSGQWEKEELYNLTQSRTLTVHYPPSPPSITRADVQTRPPKEGDTVTLTCSLTSQGFPSATLTWPSEGENVITNPLPLTVDRGDNQRSVTCQAINDFTQHRGTEMKDSFTLEVYYGPDINLHPADDNRCDMTSERTSCHVTEGQRVHLLCNATSNPAARNCVWQVISGSGNNLDPGPDLDIVSVNRSDSGVYQVQVETTKPDSSDDRLPLTAHGNLTVLVKYRPTQPNLLANKEVSITVSEEEAVTLKCQSHGRPTPRLELLHRDKELAREDGGRLSLSEEKSQLSHSITARCHNTGIVTCRADNGVGSVQQLSVQLYVNCKPRNTTTDPEPPKVNFVSGSASAAFYMEAFPLPDRTSFQYLGKTQNSGSSQPVPSSIELSATCTNTYADFAVQCNVSVTDVKDSTAEGFYTFTAANQFGGQSFTFQVTVNATGGPGDGGINAVAIGAGIAAGLVVIGGVVLVVWCIRRRRKKQNKPRNGHATLRDEPDQDTVMIDNAFYDSSGNVGQDGMIENVFYETSGNVAPRGTVNGGPSGSPYDEVSVDAGGSRITSSDPQAGSSESGAENLYAEVKKPKNASPAKAAPAEVSDVYATVDKTQRPPPLPPPPADIGPPEDGKPKPALKPKPDVKAKPEIKSKGEGPAKGLEHSDAGPPPRPPRQTEGTVYQNYAFQGDEADSSPGHPPTAPQAAGKGDGRLTMNPDGLVYTTVAFTDSQRQKEKDPDPCREQTDYAGLDFNRMTQEANKKP